MIGRLALVVLVAFAAGAGAFWLVTAPHGPGGDRLAAVAAAAPEAARGEAVFWAAGCASCHAAPEAEGEALLVLAGGQRFPSDFGTFVAPNISPDPEHGIGGWSLEDFATALLAGVSPGGRHYYPAFPYTAYTRMTAQDVADLWAFMGTLPAAATPSAPHEIGFPFSIRRSVGAWKRLYLTSDWVTPDSPDPAVTRGRYLSEALAHCGECHTPRDGLGGLDTDRWMAGAPNPSGRGTIPNVTPAGLEWSATDIAYYLETGFTPDFDSAGGHMAAVVGNFARLTAEDRAAVAAYLKALPPVATAP